MQYKSFDQISLDDPFFSSLKEDYLEFENWYTKKAAEDAHAYVAYDTHNQVQAFLYLKPEVSALQDVQPQLTERKWL